MMKSNGVGIWMLALAAVVAAPFVRAGDLPDLPNPIHRQEYHLLDPKALDGGSPEWVYRQSMLLLKERKFDELAPYESPASIWASRLFPEPAMAMATNVRMDYKLRVGDSKYEGNRCYVYMGFQRDTRIPAWQMNYHYFLKVNGKWVEVLPSEWQRGAFKPVPKH